MDLCLLLEGWVINVERNLLIQLKNLLPSKRAIQKTAEVTGDLIGNKIADKITSVTKKKSNNDNNNDDVELATHKKDTFHQKKDKKLLMN